MSTKTTRGPRTYGRSETKTYGRGARLPAVPKMAAAPAKPPAKSAKAKAAAKKRRLNERSTTEAAPTTAVESRALTGKAQRYLRGLGHHLDPIVQIGKDGITDGVVEATRIALLAHELIKVRVLAESPIDRKLAGDELAKRSGAALAQTLGRTLLLFKRHPHKPKIVLPR